MNDEIRREAERIRRDWDRVEQNSKELSKAFDALINSAKQIQETFIKEITVADAIARIRLELLKDKEPGSYYHAWQCNIAMCFYDEIRHRYRINDASLDPILEQNLHNYSTKAAERFLDILCLQTNSNAGLLKQSELQKSQKRARI